ncbi:MAG: GGDEF and EAL domain-containing protein [Lachnospiraceae bacterium]|nr:GGDEF and EAL domain-containing protein [Lachnospiraceae bacterium]
MRSDFFKWDEFSSEQGIVFPAEAIEEIFLVDLNDKSVWLSKKLARMIFFERGELRTELSLTELADYFLEGGIDKLIQEIERMLAGKTNRVNSHVSLIRGDTALSAVCYVFKLKQPRFLLGFLSIDYEPIQEYEQELENTIKELKRIQAVNDLVLDGAADYIYQLDIVKNICTFSPKALEVLPLESPVVTDAVSKMLSFVIPEDRKLWLDSLTPIITGEADYHRAKYRVRGRDGEIKWLLSQGKCLRDENGKLLMLAGSMVDITQQQIWVEEMNQMLYVDPLTGLKNRLGFEKDMEEHLKKRDIKGSLVYINIRKFKLFNEMFGRSFADTILKEFAERLKLYFPEALGIYRFTGDEFLIHLGEYDREEIMARVIPFRSSLRSQWEMDGHMLYINMYAAVVIYPENGNNVEVLLQHANQCLSQASRDESAEVRFFAEQEGEQVSRQYLLENTLRKDIQNGFEHFRVVYQPIVHIEDGVAKWGGAEALLRYHNPELPDVGQMEMIQTLEYSGLILPVGRWVLAQAVKECNKWNRAGKQVVVHVNMAAQQVTDAGLVEYIKKQCAESRLPHSSLIVELTETSLVNNFAMATQLCEELREVGIGVALDDFGTGYSGFTYLKNFPINQIKVDREYARDISNNRYNQVIVSFMHNLSRNMDVELCVEGVETEQELEVLVDIGVSTIQGFYFERPMEADVIRKEFMRRAVGTEEEE